MRKWWPILLLMLCVLACKSGRKPQQAPTTYKPFPRVEVPSIMGDDLDGRARWLAGHYWDKYLSSASDSLNGVSPEVLDQEMGMYVSILGTLPLADGQKAVEQFYNKLDEFGTPPGSSVFEKLADLMRHYLYDPNSPVRSEDLYLPFVTRLAESALLPQEMRMARQWEARMCALNRIGSVAADFAFEDLAGKSHRMHGIKADYLLLIFGNPDCTACRELTEKMGGSAEISALINSGKLKVADIYIDEDIDLWRSKADDYPSQWINGCDPGGLIRGNIIYNVRAIPSLYLLDSEKRVLLKDAPEERVLDYLSAL